MSMEKRNIILIKKRKIEYSTRETSKSRFEREKERENLNNSRPEPIEALSSRASFNLLLLLLKLLLLLMLLWLREAPDAPTKFPPLSGEHQQHNEGNKPNRNLQKKNNRVFCCCCSCCCCCCYLFSHTQKQTIKDFLSERYGEKLKGMMIFNHHSSFQMF